MKTIKWNCKNCFKEMETYSCHVFSFCSPKCNYQYKKIIYFSECIECGEIFSGGGKGREVSYCSNKCRYKNRKIWNKGKRKYIFDCKNCGKHCESSTHNKYCDQKCWTSSKEFSDMTRKNGIKYSKKGFNPYIRVTHSMSNTPTYRVWADMKNRCYNKNIKAYKWYGKRGIEVCDRWLDSFENFLEDMGEKPNKLTLDRIDNDGNYEPKNCRWATRKQQANNTRRNKL